MPSCPIRSLINAWIGRMTGEVNNFKTCTSYKSIMIDMAWLKITYIYIFHIYHLKYCLMLCFLLINKLSCNVASCFPWNYKSSQYETVSTETQVKLENAISWTWSFLYIKCYLVLYQHSTVWPYRNTNLSRKDGPDVFCDGSFHLNYPHL